MAPSKHMSWRRSSLRAVGTSWPVPGVATVANTRLVSTSRALTTSAASTPLAWEALPRHAFPSTAMCRCRAAAFPRRSMSLRPACTAWSSASGSVAAMTRPSASWLGSFSRPSARSNPCRRLGLCPAMSFQNRTTAVGPFAANIIATAIMASIPA
jgi:hypothetical protein